MFSYSYKYCDHFDYLHGLAAYAGVPVINNTIQLPAAMGNGYIKVIELANGLQVLINECTINEEVHFYREPVIDESYTLRFDEVKNLKALSLQMDNDKLDEKDRVYSGAFLTNSLIDFSYTANAGLEDRCVNIYFTAAWLKNYAGISSADEAFKEYLSLKTANLNFEVLNVEYRALMEDIFEVSDDHPMQKVILQNRVMLLVEKFFRSLYSRMGQQKESKVLLNDAAIKRMMQVESILVNNLSEPPPTIPVLARTAMMSETKLKNLFKTLYGLSMYEYYQKKPYAESKAIIAL